MHVVVKLFNNVCRSGSEDKIFQDIELLGEDNSILHEEAWPVYELLFGELYKRQPH